MSEEEEPQSPARELDRKIYFDGNGRYQAYFNFLKAFENQKTLGKTPHGELFLITIDLYDKFHNSQGSINLRTSKEATDYLEIIDKQNYKNVIFRYEDRKTLKDWESLFVGPVRLLNTIFPNQEQAEQVFEFNSEIPLEERELFGETFEGVLNAIMIHVFERENLANKDENEFIEDFTKLEDKIFNDVLIQIYENKTKGITGYH